jgi:hypothetical protein
VAETKRGRRIGFLNDLKCTSTLQYRQHGRDAGFERVRQQVRLETPPDHGGLREDRAIRFRQRPHVLEDCGMHRRGQRTIRLLQLLPVDDAFEQLLGEERVALGDVRNLAPQLGADVPWCGSQRCIDEIACFLSAERGKLDARDGAAAPERAEVDEVRVLRT